MKAAAARAALAALPVLDLDQAFGPGPLLVLAPHPDDESLGCGGLIAEACARGREVHVAILTDGGASHRASSTWPRSRLAAVRAEEARAATSLLGLPPGRLHLLGARDGRAPHWGLRFARLRRRLVALIEAHGIATVCASWIGDPHGDHGAAAKLARAAAARCGARHWAYPVWALTLPDAAELPAVTGGFRLDVSRHLVAKRRAIAAHASQHGRVVTDDPSGFVLPADFLALFDRTWETFIEPP